MGRARARDTRRRLVRRAVPPAGARRAPASNGDDGHARLARDTGGLWVVDGRPAGRDRCRDVLRDRRRGHDADPARPLPRAAGEAAVGRCAPVAPRAWCREATVLVADGEAVVPVAEPSPATSSSCARASGSRRTASSSRVAAAVDASMLTGEPLPIDVEPGHPGRRAGRSTSTGASSCAPRRSGRTRRSRRIARLVTQAQAAKAPVQRLADRISAVFVPAVLPSRRRRSVAGSSSATARPRRFAAAVAVLIIACPCALGLATPTAILVGSGRGAQLGILIRGPEVLEHARRLTTVALDKTGTITTGEMRVVRVVARR